MIEINDKEVYTDDAANKRVHRLNTEHYFIRCTKLPSDTLATFEEVDISQAPQDEDITPPI